VPACTTEIPVAQLPQVDASGQPIIDGSDIAIVGQELSHALMDLSEISGATIPPLVQFKGVTSVVNGPVDTAPYTELLRDRLLLLTREKLRFVERRLPPLHGHKKDVSPTEGDTDAQYELTAQLRGQFNDPYYLIDIQFSDTHSGEVVFHGLYRIRKELEEQPAAPTTAPGAPQDSTLESTAPNPAPAPDPSGGSIQ